MMLGIKGLVVSDKKIFFMFSYLAYGQVQIRIHFVGTRIYLTIFSKELNISE